MTAPLEPHHAAGYTATEEERAAVALAKRQRRLLDRMRVNGRAAIARAAEARDELPTTGT